MKAGIVIDNWKFQIFKRRLNQANFIFNKKPGVTKDTSLLVVEVDTLEKLAEIVEAANGEAKLTGAPKNGA